MHQRARGDVRLVRYDAQHGRLVARKRAEIDLHIQPRVGPVGAAGQGREVDARGVVVESAADDQGRIIAGVAS